jgi:hypothetical protein
MTATFHRSGHLEQFAIEVDGRHVCLVFTEADAVRITEALNAGPIASMTEFIRGLRVIGLGDCRSAEVLLALVRQGANLLVGETTHDTP